MSVQNNPAAVPDGSATPPETGPPRSRLSGIPFLVFTVLGGIGLLMAINQVFLLKIGGFQPLGNAYLYYLIGIFLSVAFLCIPARPGDASRVRWYDWVLVVAVSVAALYLGNNGLRIIAEGWEFSAPIEASVAAAVMMVAALEGVRRGGGNALLATALLFGCYPLFADYMPGFLWGSSFSLSETVRAHVLGVESIVGIPMQVVAELVIGFVIFGSVLTATRGSEFFMDLAAALLGRSRGGPAKVSVLSSGLLGSLSGSVISNILTTGPFTIPTMRRVGYAKEYAAAIEATASSGATLMPPIMGTVAFIMASFLGVPYADVAIAAFLPAVLFYVALLLQVDLYAAREGLKGLPQSEIPPLGRTLLKGWPYLLSLVVLIFVLMVMRLESYSPYFASAVMILATSFNKETRLNAKRALDLLVDVTKNVGSLVAILAGIGLVVGGLSYTGVAGAFSRELLLLADGNVLLMLIAGAVTSFILGLGMTVSACYIFLSILLAPALVNAGLDPIGSHLFILYWGMLSYITPPVALASITAANIAKSDPFKTSIYTMRLGNAKFILPFIFIYDPALLFNGSAIEVLQALSMAVIGLWALTVAFEGYLYRVGVIPMVSRIAFAAGAILTIIPEFYTDIAGLALIAGVAVFEWLRRGRGAGVAP